MSENQNQALTGFGLRRGLWAGAGLLFLSTLIIFSFVQMILSAAVDGLVRDQAGRSSAQWETFFHAQLPDVEGAFARRSVNQAQRAVINRALLSGDVFRFKMFAPDGTLFFTSDEDGAHNLPAPDGMTTPQRVFLTGAPDIALRQGADTPDRPDLYAEAYVPAHTPDGHRVGVIEVYVDQTATAAALETAFEPLQTTLPLLAMLIYLVPSLGLLVVIEQKRRRDLRLESARNDSLTGVLTRGAFLDAVKLLFEAGKSRPTHIGLLFIDVDNFKAVNDTMGHAAGDSYLRVIAAAIKNFSRADDILCRYGGDEFVMVMPGITMDALEQRAKKICAAARQGAAALGHEIGGSVSIGAYAAGPGDPLDTALKRADQALYSAKRQGRDTFAFYDSDPPPRHPAAAA